jgi:hypothetical protein
MSYGGKMLVANGRPLPDVGEAGWLSYGGALKAGSTVGRFTLARNWAVAQRGAVACAGRRQRSAGSGRRKGVTPWVGRLGCMDTQADWPAGPTRPKAREEFFRI